VQEIPARDARGEALAWARRLRADVDDVLVLEPAPPAVAEPPWYADREPDGDRVVAPFGPGEWRWETLAGEDRVLRAWCEERWLGPYRRLRALPAQFAPTRDALHLLARLVISPAREAANGKIGLRWTLGGFGTPFFGPDAQVRVEAGTLVTAQRARGWRAPIETIGAARELLGELAGPAPDEPDQPLRVDPASAVALGDLYGFASSVLEELRHATGEPARVQLWPEHFDVAIEIGDEAAGQRAACGVSPGDADHAEPYLYVAPFAQVPAGALWQATGFAGAELGYRELTAAADQRASALEFFQTRLADLRRLSADG
jgi:hypothetical protein